MKTLKFQNKNTKTYYKQVLSKFPLLGKQEKAFLYYFQETLQEFESHHPHYQCNDYYHQFGLPEEIVSAYYEHIESEYIIAHMKARKFMKYIGIFLVVISTVVSLYIIYTYYLAFQEFQDSQIYYEQTIIQDYGDIIEENE